MGRSTKPLRPPKKRNYMQSPPLGDRVILFGLGFLRIYVRYLDSQISISIVSMADWAELPHDMLEVIVQKINQIKDYVIFGSVCKSWRDAKNLRRPQNPCLMLLDKPPGDDHRQIYSPSKEDIIFKNLYIPEISDRRCIGLHYGWVLAVTRLPGEINLINPISRSQIELPPPTSIDRCKYTMPAASYTFITSAALSGNPSESSDLIVMIVNAFGNAHYWRRGSKHWIRINEHGGIHDMTYYQDRFYSVSYNSDVWGYKVDRDHDSIVAYKINTTECHELANYSWPYIVGSTCGLLLVARETRFEQGEEDVPKEELDDDCTNRHRFVNIFHVFEFDLISGSYKQTKNLGDRAIFVGHNTSISIDNCASDFPGIKSNHIYFTEEYLFLLKGGRRVLGAYSLKDAQIIEFKIEESSTRSGISRPFWFIPSL